MNVLGLNRLAATILLKDWDPIGISDEPAAQDEYESYVSEVATMIARGASEKTIASYLLAVESELMGLPQDQARADRVAGLLIGLR